MQERGSFFSIGLKYSLPVLSCLTYFFTQKAPASNICYRLPSTHGRWGEMGGGCPFPSVQKPIPSPRAKNQGPLKKLGQERGNIEIYENLFFNFCGWGRPP